MVLKPGLGARVTHSLKYLELHRFQSHCFSSSSQANHQETEIQSSPGTCPPIRGPWISFPFHFPPGPTPPPLLEAVSAGRLWGLCGNRAPVYTLGPEWRNDSLLAPREAAGPPLGSNVFSHRAQNGSQAVEVRGGGVVGFQGSSSRWPDGNPGQSATASAPGKAYIFGAPDSTAH